MALLWPASIVITKQRIMHIFSQGTPEYDQNFSWMARGRDGGWWMVDGGRWFPEFVGVGVWGRHGKPNDFYYKN